MVPVLTELQDDTDALGPGGSRSRPGGSGSLAPVLWRLPLKTPFFTPGNLAVLRVGDNSQALAGSGNTVYIRPIYPRRDAGE